MSDLIKERPLIKLSLQGALLGVVTGFTGTFLTWLLFLFSDLINISPDTPIFILTAGICFGLGLGWMAKRRFSIANWAIFLITALTPIIYSGAYFSARILIGNAEILETLYSGFVGGFLGAGLVAVLCIILMPIPHKIRFFIVVTGIGAVTGALVMLIYVDQVGRLTGLYFFHMIWHASVLAAIFGEISGPISSQAGK